MISKELRINPNKCQSIGFGATESIRTNWHQLQYSIGNTNINIESTPRYLGVLLDSSLSWSAHIQHITNVAIKKLHLIRRVASPHKGLQTKQLMLLYKTFFKPSIEYAQVVWMNQIRNKSVLCKLNKTDNQVKRIVLGALQTTAIVSLEAELQTAPPHIRLHQQTSHFLLNASLYNQELLHELTQQFEKSTFIKKLTVVINQYHMNSARGLNPKLITRGISSHVDDLWQQHRHREGKGLHHCKVTPSLSTPKPSHWNANLSRSLEVAVTRLRLGHVLTMEHKRIKFHQDVPIDCRLCLSGTENITHLLCECRSLYRERRCLHQVFFKHTLVQRKELITPELILGDSFPNFKIRKKTRLKILKKLIPLINVIRKHFPL